MMKNLLSVFAMLLISLSLFSQTIVDTAQRAKNVVLEEFTGIHCQYCPQGHALAQGIQNANPNRVVLINIHEGNYSTPATGEPDYRTSFGTALANQTALTGFPCGTVNRHVFSGLEMTTGGTAMGRANWTVATNQILAQNSIVNIGVTSQYDTSTKFLTVHVELYYTGSSATSQNFLNVAFIQDSIVGDQQNGSTWQTNYVHMHMLKNLITGQWGDTIFTTTQGTFVSRTYHDSIPASYNSIPCDLSHCDVAVFVTESTQEIENGEVVNAIGGSNANSYIGSTTGPANDIASSTSGNTHIFSGSAVSSLLGTNNFQFVLTSDAPSGWTSSFSVNSNNFSDTGVVSLSSGVPATITINATPDATSKVATYTLTMTSVSYPSSPAKYFKTYLIANVTDLVVNGSGSASWTGGTGAADFESQYLAGLSYAGNTTNSSTSATVMEKGISQNAFAGVRNIYANIAWTFPGLLDNEAIALETFLNNGGNLYIAGQDLGWDIMSTNTAAHGTTVTRNFYTNYLHALFIGDGTSTNTPINADPNDTVFHLVPSSAITVGPYGAGHMYPDSINVTGGSVPVFYYGTGTSRVAGIRYFMGGYKIVYLAPGLEQMSNTTTKNMIIKKSHDWFYGLFTGVEDLYKNSMISVYPNPTSDNIYIGTKSDNFEVSIFDMSGKLISVEKSKRVIDISGLSNGLYLINVKEGNQNFRQRISVVK